MKYVNQIENSVIQKCVNMASQNDHITIHLSTLLSWLKLFQNIDFLHGIKFILKLPVCYEILRSQIACS